MHRNFLVSVIPVLVAAAVLAGSGGSYAIAAASASSSADPADPNPSATATDEAEPVIDTASGPKPPPITVEVLTSPKLGLVLADLNGMTLYQHDLETNGNIVCTGDCLLSWSPLLHTPGAPLKMPPGRHGTLSVVKRLDVGEQVAFNGRPLYRYMGDHEPGDTNGEGAPWHAVRAPKR
jgi:predicted lipoprotein with Yx(FWY)xxD motif